MISIQEYNKQFIARHDFSYADIKFLPNKYSNILFKDIPEAWVCCIDDYLSRIKEHNKVVSISQIYGFPVIQYENDINSKDFEILKQLERTILCMDVDLQDQLDSGAVIN